METFQVKFEDYNQKKHLRDFWELCHPLGVKTQLCKFLGTEGYMLDSMIDSLCNPDISIMWPHIRLRRIVIFSGIVWLMLGEYCSLWLSRYFCQWRRFGYCIMHIYWVAQKVCSVITSYGKTWTTFLANPKPCTVGHRQETKGQRKFFYV